jgi:hypothetical protein
MLDTVAIVATPPVAALYEVKTCTHRQPRSSLKVLRRSIHLVQHAQQHRARR